MVTIIKKGAHVPPPHSLEGKKILIVDDDPDILETLTDMLDMCVTDTAENFETAASLLERNTYDMTVLDVMGVKAISKTNSALDGWWNKGCLMLDVIL